MRNVTIYDDFKINNLQDLLNMRFEVRVLHSWY